MKKLNFTINVFQIIVKIYLLLMNYYNGIINKNIFIQINKKYVKINTNKYIMILEIINNIPKIIMKYNKI